MATSVPPRKNRGKPDPLWLAFCSLLSFGLAVGVLARSKWGPLLENYVPATDTEWTVARVAIVYALVSGGHAFVLWIFNRFLNEIYGYRGADRAVLVVVGLLCFDVIADLNLARSGAAGFALYPIPLGLFRLMLSYPQFAHFGLGIALIAFGYGLLRFPHNLHGVVRPYAQAQIATGMVLTSLVLTTLWPWIAAFGHVLLGQLLYRLSNRRSTA